MNESPEPTGYEYDVCLSFAGEQRSYVEDVTRILLQRGIRVFYDDYEKINLWGKDLYEHLDRVYRYEARYCILFVSADYARKVWTNHERKGAQARALHENTEYVLPARFDDTEIPGLRPTVSYVDLRVTHPDELADLIIGKLGTDMDVPEQSKSFIVTPTNVPRTPEQTQQLLLERPQGWEYLLFAGTLTQAKEALEPKWRDHELQYARRSGRYFSDTEAADYLSRACNEAGAIASNVGRILSPNSYERAFGAPGEPGDPARIEHLAGRVVGVYEDLLDWAADTRSVIVSDGMTWLFELAARLADRPCKGIREFIDETVEEVERIPEILQRAEPTQINLVLLVETDDDIVNQLEREMNRVKRQHKA